MRLKYFILLFVCRYHWSEAVIEHLNSVPLHSIQHLSTTKDYIESSQITIISYDLLTRRIDEIAARKFGVILCVRLKFYL